MKSLEMKPSRDFDKINFSVGDILFHPLHGLCEIKAVVDEEFLGQRSLCYLIEPKRHERANTRFLIVLEQIFEAGFHPPISAAEVQEILEYLKNTGTDSTLNVEKAVEMVYALAKENTPWAFAKIIYILAFGVNHVCSRHEREILKRAVQGLTREMALVLKLSASQASSLIRRSLGPSLRSNAWIRGELERVE